MPPTRRKDSNLHLMVTSHVRYLFATSLSGLAYQSCNRTPVTGEPRLGFSYCRRLFYTSIKVVAFDTLICVFSSERSVCCFSLISSVFFKMPRGSTSSIVFSFT